MLLEIVSLAYENPVKTMFFLLGIAIIVSEFTPIVILKNDPKPEKEKK